jgi:hypothetical protein
MDGRKQRVDALYWDDDCGTRSELLSLDNAVWELEDGMPSLW